MHSSEEDILDSSSSNLDADKSQQEKSNVPVGKKQNEATVYSTFPVQPGGVQDPPAPGNEAAERAEVLTIDDPQIVVLEAAFVTTYNTLASGYCDPLFRTLTDAEISTIGSLAEDGTLAIEVRATGSCRGCDPSLGVDIYDLPTAASVGSQRHLKNDFVHDPSRRLQDLKTCYCSAQAVAQRAPSESEFITAFQPTVKLLQLDCIGSIRECQFGSLFATDIIISFEGDESLLSEGLRAAIEENPKATLNDLFVNSEATCNPDFRVIESVVALFDDFTLNGDFIELNETDATEGCILNSFKESSFAAAAKPKLDLHFFQAF